MLVRTFFKQAWDRLSGGAQVGVMASGVLVAYVAFIAVEEGQIEANRTRPDPRDRVNSSHNCILTDCSPPAWEETPFLMEGETLEERPYRDANKWRSLYNPIRRQYPDARSCMVGGATYSGDYSDAKLKWPELSGEAEAEVCLFRLFSKLETVERIKVWADRIGYRTGLGTAYTDNNTMPPGKVTELTMYWDMHNPEARYGRSAPFCVWFLGNAQSYYINLAVADPGGPLGVNIFTRECGHK